MCSGVKETQCTHCDHLQVCSLKEEFAKAQHAVDDVYVIFSDANMKYLRDFDWIKPVELECKHFAAKRLPSPPRDIFVDHHELCGVVFCPPEGESMEDPS